MTDLNAMDLSNHPLILGIETSCDETAVAILAADGTVLAEPVLSQLDDHAPFGGVVPEVAARAHLAHLGPLIDQALKEAGADWSDIDAVAATAGPGLIGGVMVGLTWAKGLSVALDKPLYAINHLEGHALTARLSHDAEFPYLLALMSGGHCQLLLVEAVGCYRRLGTTIDDAVGEAFDKTAKLLSLGYPGGPALERLAKEGDPKTYDLPRPLMGREGCHFSFSGLKSAIARIVEALPEGPIPRGIAADLAASFQAAVADCLGDRTRNALKLCYAEGIAPTALVVAGGVAANQTLRTRLSDVAEGWGIGLMAPPMHWCTDNAVMIAWAAQERHRMALPADPLSVKPRPRWPLDPEALPALGKRTGKAGAKA